MLLMRKTPEGEMKAPNRPPRPPTAKPPRPPQRNATPYTKVLFFERLDGGLEVKFEKVFFMSEREENKGGPHTNVEEPQTEAKNTI